MAKRREESIYKRFVQLNLEHSEDYIKLMITKPREAGILFFLIDHMDNYNAVVVSYEVIQEYFNISKSTVSRAVAYLKKHGFIFVYKSGTSNVYAVNDRLVWKSWHKNIKFSKFPANVILSLEEQDQDFKKTKITRESKIELINKKKE